MKFIIGFFMAWGNFITIPCPYKRWDSSLKNMMLAFLPSVGVVVGVLWAVLYYLLDWIGVPVMLGSFVMMFYIFFVCGFMHMDGFMDCNDAILSRRPLEERQRILKDSTVGAFAVVTVAFLLIGWFAAMTEAYMYLNWADLLIIPVVSRGAAGAFVLSYRPIGHSQYVEDFKEPHRGKYRAAIAVQLLLVGAVALFFGPNPFRTLAVGAVMIGVASIACAYARADLQGMSGDIAGYTICLSELAGIIALALC